ncbi:TBC domain-containing protein [Cyclospora cayetanensis]|uniref:TBC domain-containing protein n=1 Tax=Cyclospora cayetanensis TaxID=88456 RepID=A0A1D3CRM2_9EIME|nr:TBC domain-containing protein [Cyclospora cayetanensis]
MGDPVRPSRNLLYEQLALFPPDITPLCINPLCPVRGFVVDCDEVQLPSRQHEALPDDGGCVDCDMIGDYRTQLRQFDQWRFWISTADFALPRNKQALKTRIRNGIPPPLRGAVWQQLVQVEKFKQEEGISSDLYLRLSSGAAPSVTVLSMIARDVNRTFPKHPLFRDQKAAGQQVGTLEFSE